MDDEDDKITPSESEKRFQLLFQTGMAIQHLAEAIRQDKVLEVLRTPPMEEMSKLTSQRWAEQLIAQSKARGSR